MKFLWKILTYIKPAGPMMLLAVLLGCLAVAGNVVLLALAAYLISLAALHPPLAALSTAIVGVRFFGIARALLRYLERYTAHSATFSLMGMLRTWIYARIEPLLPAEVQRNNGELLTLLMQDVETMRDFYLRLLAPPAVAGIILLAALCLFSELDTAFLYVLLAAFFICGVLCPAGMYYWQFGNAGQLLRTRASLNGHIIDGIDGMTELAAFQYGEKLTGQMIRTGKRLTALQARITWGQATSEAIGLFTLHGSVWCILYLAVRLVETGQLPGVYLAVLVFAVQSGFEAVLPLTTASRYLPESAAAAKRLFSLPESAVSQGRARHKGRLNGTVTLERVEFRYSKDASPVLKNISFSLRPGRQVAVVGPSGAGKSSLIAALLQFGYCDKGSITFDGKDSTYFSPEAVREIFSVVPQQVYLFHASIKENILLAKPTASQAELEAVISQAALDELIHSLPQGVDTLVGQHGQALSGGQRQRIGIARALLKEAPVLLLDEPFAHLDTLTASRVLAGLQETLRERSSLWITHQLTGLEMMEEILVVHQGEMVERGTLRELLAQQGMFWQMWCLQQDRLPFE